MLEKIRNKKQIYLYLDHLQEKIMDWDKNWYRTTLYYRNKTLKSP